MSPWSINRLVHAISAGAVFGYPTDTIWGFGCHPLIANSVERILDIKGRQQTKGLILLCSNIDFCADYLRIGDEELNAIRLPARQPTTWLVEASDFCPPWIRGRHPTVGIRITDHPLVQAICDRLRAPIVSTSANRSGRKTARNLWQMHRQFGEELDFIVSGFATGGVSASRIKSLASGAIIRKEN